MSKAKWIPALAAVAGLMLSGCIKSKQTYTIYPDGSGKADVSMTLMGMMAQMVKMGGQMGAPGDEGEGPKKPEDMLKESIKGKVYWSNIQTKDGDGGTFIMTGTAYFEDVKNLAKDDGEGNSMEFTKTEDGGFKLVMTNDGEFSMPGMPGGEGFGGEEEEGGESTPEQDAMKEQMTQMMKGMLAGFEMQMRFVLPGSITAVDGFTSHEGRNAVFTIGEQEVADMMDKKAKPPTTLSATASAPAEGFDAEFATFKEALAEAKAAAEEAAAAEAEKEGKPEAKPEGEDKDKGGDSEF